MSHQTKKTNNSNLQAKIDLRVNSLPPKQEITVLDCFHGEGTIWNKIKELCPDKSIKVLGIDKKKYNNDFVLIGDNCKYLKSLDLNAFDIIDLDAYGIPYKQLDIIFKKHLSSKIIYVTYIQSSYGILPVKMLNDIGIPSHFIKKIPTLFNMNGFEKFKKYLSLQRVDKIRYYCYNRKYYLVFNL